MAIPPNNCKRLPVNTRVYDAFALNALDSSSDLVAPFSSDRLANHRLWPESAV